MASLNQVSLIGNLGKDPEVRTLQNGNKVANFNVATTEKWKDKASGERKEKTEWHRIVIFGSLTDIADKYLNKGSKVFLQGSLQTRKWQDQSGADKYTTEVVLQGFSAKMIMLDGKRAGEEHRGDESDGGWDSGEETRGTRSGRQAAGMGSRPAPSSDLDDDIPFAPQWQ